MSIRQPLIAGNWKMHHTAPQAVGYFASFVAQVGASPAADVWLFPPATAIAALCGAAMGHWLHVGAQNLHEADQGAFTGELSAAMLKDAGAAGVLIGHSERRHVFGETDHRIAAKLATARRHEMLAFLCVGETLAEREAGSAETVVRRQLAAALAEQDPAQAAEIVVAYEPVWAIGTGVNATPEQAQQMHAIVRSALGAAGERTRILYGGSVKPDNAAELLSQPDVDGLLVGGASLDPKDFAAIVAAA